MRKNVIHFLFFVFHFKFQNSHAIVLGILANVYGRLFPITPRALALVGRAASAHQSQCSHSSLINNELNYFVKFPYFL